MSEWWQRSGVAILADAPSTQIRNTQSLHPVSILNLFSSFPQSWLWTVSQSPSLWRSRSKCCRVSAWRAPSHQIPVRRQVHEHRLLPLPVRQERAQNWAFSRTLCQIWPREPRVLLPLSWESTSVHDAYKHLYFLLYPHYGLVHVP